MSWYAKLAEAKQKIYGQAFEVETLEDIRECAFRGTTVEVVDSEGNRHTYEFAGIALYGGDYLILPSMLEVGKYGILWDRDKYRCDFTIHLGLKQAKLELKPR